MKNVENQMMTKNTRVDVRKRVLDRDKQLHIIRTREELKLYASLTISTSYQNNYRSQLYEDSRGEDEIERLKNMLA